MEQLKWRLSKLPTVEELTSLEEKKILTKEEVKKILFNNETVEERDVESYKQEIKLLREVIDKLADKEKVATVITQYIPQYITQPFYQPYYYWANPNYTVTCASSSQIGGASGGGGAMYCSGTSGTGITNASYTCTSANNALSDLTTY